MHHDPLLNSLFFRFFSTLLRLHIVIPLVWLPSFYHSYVTALLFFYHPTPVTLGWPCTASIYFYASSLSSIQVPHLLISIMLRLTLSCNILPFPFLLLSALCYSLTPSFKSYQEPLSSAPYFPLLSSPFTTCHFSIISAPSLSHLTFTRLDTLFPLSSFPSYTHLLVSSPSSTVPLLFRVRGIHSSAVPFPLVITEIYIKVSS